MWTNIQLLSWTRVGENTTTGYGSAVILGLKNTKSAKIIIYTKISWINCNYFDLRTACSHAQDEALYATHCPPQIDGFEPKSGPIYGNTTVVIKGFNLENADIFTHNKVLNVTIAYSNCQIISKGSNKIVCKTQNVDSQRKGNNKFNYKTFLSVLTLFFT